MQHTMHDTDRTFTLADIAESHGVKKRAVQLWLSKARAEHGELGEMKGKTRYYNEAEKQILLSHAGEPRAKAEPVTMPPAAAESVALASTEIVPGNHRISLDGPEIGGQIDLARFRGSLEVRSYADPCHPANAAIQLLEAVESAMDSDLEQSFQQLEMTAETVAQLEAKTRQLEAKSLEYKITQQILGRLQNQATGHLESLLGKATALTGNEPRL